MGIFFGRVLTVDVVDRFGVPDEDEGGRHFEGCASLGCCAVLAMKSEL